MTNHISQRYDPRTMSALYTIDSATLTINGVSVQCQDVQLTVPDRIDEPSSNRHVARPTRCEIACTITHLNPKAMADIVGPFWHGSDEKYQEGVAENERVEGVMQSLKTLFLD